LIKTLPDRIADDQPGSEVRQAEPMRLEYRRERSPDDVNREERYLAQRRKGAEKKKRRREEN